MENESFKRFFKLSVGLQIISAFIILALVFVVATLPGGFLGKTSTPQQGDKFEVYMQALTEDLNQYVFTYKNKDLHIGTTGIQQPDNESGDIVGTIDIMNEADEKIANPSAFEGGYFVKDDRARFNISTQRNFLNTVAHTLFLADLEKETGKAIKSADIPVKLVMNTRDLNNYSIILSYGDKKTTFGFQQIDEHHYVISTI